MIYYVVYRAEIIGVFEDLEEAKKAAAPYGEEGYIIITEVKE